jgi:hypothetical protein
MEILIPIVSIVFVVISFTASRIKAQDERSTQNGKILKEIENLNKAQDRIINKLDSQLVKCISHSERIVVVEQKCNALHKRVDRIEGRNGND